MGKNKYEIGDTIYFVGANLEKIECPFCKGKKYGIGVFGDINIKVKCPVCDGSGFDYRMLKFVEKRKIVGFIVEKIIGSEEKIAVYYKIDIPATKDGSKIIDEQLIMSKEDAEKYVDDYNKKTIQEIIDREVRKRG